MSSAGGPSGERPGDAPRRDRGARAPLTEPLERSQEIAELEGVTSAALTGEGRVVLLEGAAGLGKTLLLTVAVRHAQERGMTVLRARGGELERQFPFGVTLQLLEPWLSAASARERRRVLAGAAAHAEPVLSGQAHPRDATGPPEFPLLHGLHWIAVNIAERQPLLLAIDDAHAADEASLRALLYTAQRIEDLPLAILLTARPRPGGDDALTALATHSLARRLELGTLSETAIAAIVRAQLPNASDGFCAACARTTGGNPFFARELLAALTSAGVPPDDEHAERVGEFGPTTIARAIGARLERLPAGAGALLADPRERARALAQLGQALYAAGDNPSAASAFDEGLQILAGADPELEEELTAGYLGAARLDFRTREAALTRFRDLLSGSTEATTPAQRELLAQRALEHTMFGSSPREDVVALIRRAFGGDRMLRQVSADAVAYVGAVAALLFCDALDEVEQAAGEGLENARGRGSVVGFALSAALRGAARYLRGDLTGALGDLEGGLEDIPVLVLVRPFAQGWMALAHLDRGELDAAERLVGRPGDGEDRHFTYNWTLFSRARLALMRGDAARALDDLLECGRRQLAVPAPNPAVLPWRAEAAVAARALGRDEQAAELAAEELRLARAFGAARALGIALRAAGLVEGGAAGVALLEESVVVLGDSPSRLEHARALADLGAARRRGGQQTLARETLREALDAAHRCGATELARFAHAELVAAGARPRRPAVRGADALTPSELRVSELARQGLTNREIAQALFVSTKTVEFHLRNAYLKLRIGSRRELADALRDEQAGVEEESGAPVDRDRGTARGGAVA